MWHRHMHGGRGCAGGRGGFGGAPEFIVGFGMGRRGHGHGRGGGGGRRRMFDGSELRLVLLKLIEENPRHGYDLIREIEDRTGGAYAPSPGVVYPTVTMLEDMDLIAEQKSEGAKKVYAITNAGQAYLTEHDEAVEALMARLTDLGESAKRTNGGPIRRAMGNLRAVLQTRMDEGELGSDLLHDIAAIIDEAAQKIERRRRP